MTGINSMLQPNITDNQPENSSPGVRKNTSKFGLIEENEIPLNIVIRTSELSEGNQRVDSSAIQSRKSMEQIKSHLELGSVDIISQIKKDDLSRPLLLKIDGQKT